MHNETISNSSSADSDIWTWIILAALLVLATLTAVGALALIHASQQGELPTGNQSLPSPR